MTFKALLVALFFVPFKLTINPKQMKKIFGLTLLILILSACSIYNYESSYHGPSILFEESEVFSNPDTWNFYVHDGYDRSHKGIVTSIDSNFMNTIVESPQPLNLPEVLKPSEYSRKNEVHVFVNELNLSPNTPLEFKESDIREVMMYSNPRKKVENNQEESKSVVTLVLGILGIVFVSIGIAALLIWLAIESFLNSIGCYIATMAYGSYDAPEVRVLRRFRDEVLKKTFIGRVFIANYYAFSPLLVKFVKKTGFAEKFIRRRLDSFVIRLKQKHNW